MKKVTLFILSLTICSLTFGQASLSLYYLENIPQSNLLNAAKAPRCNGYFGVPAINGVYTSFHTNVSTPELFQKSGDKWLFITNRGYDYTNLYKRIDKSANFQLSQSLSLINLGWRTNKGYITVAINEQMDGLVKIPVGFFTLIDKALPNNTILECSELGLNTKYYRELVFGYQQDYSKEFSYGIHGKLLFGLAAFKSDVSKFTMNNVGGKLIIDINSDFYSSMPLDVSVDENNIPDDIQFQKLSQKDILDKTLLNFKNPGAAIDLGAEYKLNDSWRFSGAINDLGFILWTSDLNSFHANGKYSSEYLAYVNGNNVDSMDFKTAMNQLVDSIRTAVELDSRKDGFTTTLSPKMYLGAQFIPNHYFSMGFLSKSTFRKNAFYQEFNLSANLNLYRGFSTTLNYTVSTKGAYYLGFGFAERLGPLQFYTMLDYIPTRYRFYKVEDSPRIPGPYDLQDFNLMLGVNIIFGGNGFRDKPMIDSYSEF